MTSKPLVRRILLASGETEFGFAVRSWCRQRVQNTTLLGFHEAGTTLRFTFGWRSLRIAGFTVGINHILQFKSPNPCGHNSPSPADHTCLNAQNGRSDFLADGPETKERAKKCIAATGQHIFGNAFSDLV